MKASTLSPHGGVLAGHPTRSHALAILVIVILGVSVLIVRTGTGSKKVVLDGPVASPPSVSFGPHAAAEPNGGYAGTVMSVGSKRVVGTFSGPRVEPSVAPRPSPSPWPSSNVPWTECDRGDGVLWCGGHRGWFVCSTASSGASTCRSKTASFSCSTDADTGARACDGGQTVSWRCAHDPVSGDTRCAGSLGFYECSPDPGGGAAEHCTGSHDFTCLDTKYGRACHGTRSNDPDCYFEPIFGAYCKS